MKEEIIFRALQLKERAISLIPGKSALYSIGIYVDADSLHVVCLKKSGYEIDLVDAETLKLTSRLETVTAGGEEPIPEFADITGGDSPSVDMNSEIQDSKIFVSDKIDPGKNASVLNYILGKYSHKNYQVAISLAEPQVQYSYFNKNWDPDEENVKQKIIDELSQVRPGATPLKPENLHVIKLVDGRLMAIVRDNGFNLMNLLQTAHRRYLKRLAFVESAEISLVNLVKLNYSFHEEALTIIVYIGQENSRLIFLKGKRIFNISYVIGVGIDSPNILNTIYSRILLEQDNLSLPRVNNIILTGECYEAGMRNFLTSKMPDDINIQYIQFQHLRVMGIDPILSRYAIAAGAALRALENENEFLYDVDLSPTHIREGKKFRLGVWGWSILVFLAVLTFFFTIRFGSQTMEIAQLEAQLKAEKLELEELQGMDLRLNVQRREVSNFDEVYGMLDSLMAGSDTWSKFLSKIAGDVQNSKGLWLTNLTQSGNDKVILKGYSTRREQVLEFSRRLGDATLKRVDVQEIREIKLNNFEIELPFPKE